MTATRALTMMNDHGDTTLVWTEEQDNEIIPIIEKKMKEGIAFFIIEPRMFGLLPPKKTELKKAKDALKHRALAIGDGDFSAMIEAGNVSAVKTPSEQVQTVRRAKDAKDVAKNQSVGVRQLKGG